MACVPRHSADDTVSELRAAGYDCAAVVGQFVTMPKSIAVDSGIATDSSSRPASRSVVWLQN